MLKQLYWYILVHRHFTLFLIKNSMLSKIFFEGFKSVNSVAFNVENQPVRTKTFKKLSKQVFKLDLIVNLRGIHTKDAN